MQGLMPKTCKLTSVIPAILLLLGLMTGVAHGHRRLVSSHDGEPCLNMTVYYHDIRYDSNNTANATAVAVTKPPPLRRRPVSINDTNLFGFGEIVVFDDLVTAAPELASAPVARAEGFYFSDRKDAPSAWFAFSLVFNSTAYRGTLNLMGADPTAEKTRDISVVGGTGDFFMARGVATLRTDDVSQDLYYFRLQMDIKLYECYV